MSEPTKPPPSPQPEDNQEVLDGIEDSDESADDLPLLPTDDRDQESDLGDLFEHTGKIPTPIKPTDDEEHIGPLDDLATDGQDA